MSPSRTSLMKRVSRMAGLDVTDRNMRSKLNSYLKRYKVPSRYLTGLNQEERFLKRLEIRYHKLREKQHGPSYKPSALDSKKTHSSQYTKAFYKRFPNAISLSAKSKVTGVPLAILKQVYRKGMAAWRGGQHRPGASQQAWAIARVHSFLTCGKTFYFPDHLLAIRAMQSAKAKRHFQRMGCNFRRLLSKSKSNRRSD